MVEVPCKLQWFGQISQRYMFFKCSISREKYTSRRLMFPLRHQQKLSIFVALCQQFWSPSTFTGPCAALRVVVLEKRQGSNGTEDLWVADAWPSLKGSRNEKLHVSNEKKWLVVGYRVWNPIQFCREYNKPLKRSLLTNQYNWNVARVFDHCSCCLWINHAFPKIACKIRCKCHQTLLGWRKKGQIETNQAMT